MNTPVQRRTLLKTGLTLAAVTGVGLTLGSAATAAAAPVAQQRANPTLVGKDSVNGWAMETGIDQGGAIWTRAVAGSALAVPVRIGAVATVLLHVVRRYNYEIDTLRSGEVVGFRPYTEQLNGVETNHASGTAVDIRPGWYPDGAKGGLRKRELAVVRDILRDCDGVVRWGGDLSRPAESHFEIAVRPGDPRLAALAEKLTEWNAHPGKGAGVLTNGS
ncbi:M15 family peptidase [Pseudonocardiaceae bacterium YIM PH 21723]|nr:M15 family peptidase [Pseudonocardiaceae bacterium YIM PH 21723]